MKKEKATAVTVALEHKSQLDYNTTGHFNTVKQPEFNCHDIATANFEGGNKKSKNNLMFCCPKCGKQKLGINEEINQERGGVWNCLVCRVGGNRFELAAFILGLEYPKDSGPVHFWIKNMMEKHYGKVINFKLQPRKSYSPEKAKYITRVGPTLIQETGLMILPSLVKALNLQKAAILQDIHFLCRNYHKERIRRSISEWQARLFFLHPDTVRRTLNELTADGLIEMQKEKKDIFWCICYSTLEDRVLTALRATQHDTYSNTANRA